MLIIMTVHAQVFPVGTVGRIIIVIAVFVVHGQQVLVAEVKLPAALGANKAVDLQGKLPVVAGSGCVLFHFPENLFNAFAFAGGFRPAGFLPATVVHDAYSFESGLLYASIEYTTLRIIAAFFQ